MWRAGGRHGGRHGIYTGVWGHDNMTGRTAKAGGITAKRQLKAHGMKGLTSVNM